VYQDGEISSQPNLISQILQRAGVANRHVCPAKHIHRTENLNLLNHMLCNKNEERGANHFLKYDVALIKEDSLKK
jgi:hypothetical protein